MKIDWRKKLSSRKFWAAVAGFVTAVLVALNYSQLEIEQVAAIVTGAGTLIAYIFAEGYVDGKRIDGGEELSDERRE